MGFFFIFEIIKNWSFFLIAKFVERTLEKKFQKISQFLWRKNYKFLPKKH